ncbi:hypothetical protein ABBQ32_011891 [Trebouxia sp. C0010 RCD-2024]
MRRKCPAFQASCSPHGIQSIATWNPSRLQFALDIQALNRWLWVQKALHVTQITHSEAGGRTWQTVWQTWYATGHPSTCEPSIRLATSFELVCWGCSESNSCTLLLSGLVQVEGGWVLARAADKDADGRGMTQQRG